VLPLGLRANLIIYLAVLLFAAMGLIDVVVTMAAQHVLLRAEKQKITGLLAVAGMKYRAAADRDPDPVLTGLLTSGPDRAAWLLHLGLVDASGTRHGLWGHADGPWAGPLAQLAARTMDQDEVQADFFGSTWGVFKPEPQVLLMAAPRPGDGGPAGVVVAASLLEPVYQDLRRLQAILLIYMGINGLVLTLVGFRRFHTVILKPIKRLVKAAEESRSEEVLAFGPGTDKSEFGRLSTSLNQMLRRIGRDKERLEDMVRSLEAANRQLHQAHAKILRAEKLAVAGRLSAGIAHEIGNPVSIVMGYLDLLQQQGLSEEERREFLQRSQAEVNRIHDIIARLLDLARPSPEKRRPLSVHQTVGRVVELVRGHPLMAGIEMAIDTAAACDTVMADADQLHQVLLNLFLNAADAVAGRPGQGRIAIATGNPQPCGPDSAQAMIRVAVTDNGVGIPADRLALVFDPFFSTKDPGRGTGLGLSVSLMIIEAHGGSLTVDSRPGQGAAFTVELPLINHQG